jgi:hypothetical protein
MSKREEMRQRRQQRARKQTLTAALVVTGFAGLFALLLALPTLRAALTPVGVVATAPAKDRPPATGKMLGSPDAPNLIQEFSDFR